MSDYVDKYLLEQPASFHPKHFDVIASKDKKYAGRFTGGYETKMVSLDKLAAAMCRQVWSPIVFLTGYRDALNFIEAAWMGLDFDTPHYTLEAALKDWADTVHIIGVTRNHQVDKAGNGQKFDRFRVVVPWVEPITDVHTYTHNMGLLIDKYGADSKCRDGARLFYPCASIVSLNAGGYLQPFEPPPPRSLAPAPKVYRDLGIVRRRTLTVLRAPFPDFEKNDLCFRCAKDLYDAGYPVDEIYKIIVASPSYLGNVSPDLSDEIMSCILSGIKSVKQGKAYGGNNGSGAGARKEREEKRAEEVRAVLPDHPENEPQSAGASGDA